MWGHPIEGFHSVNVDSNDQTVIQQHMLVKTIVFGEIDTPMEGIGIGCTRQSFKLFGDNLNSVALAGLVVQIRALERIIATRFGARTECVPFM